MQSGMIGKIEKAHRYAEERSRFDFHSMVVTVHGNNSDHTVHYDGERWSCDCDYFQQQRTCAHTMSLEGMLDGTSPQHSRMAVA
ncbi:MAG: SWIM zinc finger family protein [Chloroflexota bacterium]